MMQERSKDFSVLKTHSASFPYAPLLNRERADNLMRRRGGFQLIVCVLSHVLDHRRGELAALDLLGAFHLTGEVISDGLGGNGPL